MSILFATEEEDAEPVKLEEKKSSPNDQIVLGLFKVSKIYHYNPNRHLNLGGPFIFP